MDNPFALRKKSKSDQQKSLESASANSREINSRVMQWLVLSRDYLQGFQRCTACARRKTLRTSFPLPSDSRSLQVPDLGSGRPFIIHAFRARPPGGSTATSNFIRVAQATRRCKLYGPTLRSACNSHKVNNFKRLGEIAPGPAIKPHISSVGNVVTNRQVHRCFGITPKSVSPFTKYCIASATSSSPMIRTRIRMPVSPRTPRTRAAAPNTR